MTSSKMRWQLPSLSLLEMLETAGSSPHLSRVSFSLGGSSARGSWFRQPGEKKIPLLEIVFKSEVHMDYAFCNICSLLRLAVYEGDEDLWIFLLEHEINPRIHIPSTCKDHDEVWPNSSLLNFAIDCGGSFSMITSLIQYLESLPHGMGAVCDERSFLNAVARRNATILELLISKQPQTFETLKEKAWIPYEVACSSGKLLMVKTLQSKGFNMRAKDNFNRGSPLS